MEVLQLVQSNLLAPITLFFLFGIIAARIKSDLRIPEAISEFLPIYLLAAIGLHGGIEMRNTGCEEMLVPMLVAIGLSLLFTLYHYQILRRLGRFGLFDSYALASTYGAVGAVTFSVGLSFLKSQGLSSEGYLAAILAVLEPVAFVMAIFLTNMAVSKQLRQKRIAAGEPAGPDTAAKLSSVLRESVTGKAIVILLGSIVIGYIIGKEGFEPIRIVFDEMSLRPLRCWYPRSTARSESPWRLRWASASAVPSCSACCWQARRLLPRPRCCGTPYRRQSPACTSRPHSE